jgi:uncharacterized repeat protein (TIGR01451 family)
MRKSIPKRKILVAAYAIVVLAVPLALSLAVRSTGTTAQASSETSQTTAAVTTGPIVKTPVAFGESQPLRDLAPARSGATTKPPAYRLGEAESLLNPTGDGTFLSDPVVQGSGGSAAIPPTSQNFDGNNIGESSSDGVFVGAPPDTNGDVGPNHYVQTVNTVFSVYSKTGTRLLGPIPIDDIWEKAPNAAQFNCTTQSRGDPIVQYDPMANRWLISQFNFPGVAVIAPPFDQCIAISQTADPTGAYYLYDFNYSSTIFNDYPHFGVWPDAYYMSVNQFDTTTPNTDFHSAGACAFDREKMLAGSPSAKQVCFDESTFDPKDSNGSYIYGGQLPSDLDGNGFGASFATAPPAGEPNFFMQVLDSTTAGADKLLLFKFHVDWQNPNNSTFGNGTPNGSGTPIQIPVADFSLVCHGDQTLADRNCIPQVDVDPTKDYGDVTGSDIGGYLDSIGDRLMYRLAYRNFGDHESLVLNHTVNAGPGDTYAKNGNGPRDNGHAGIRWYEVRNPNGTPNVYQQSTFAPDAAHRWMGSIAMDSSGDIALGYSKSSATTHPSINYVARQASDPLSTMTFGEGTIIQGTGSQQGTGSRWGDYSSMSVDPKGCTFWYTTEYYTGNGRFGWSTRIGSFTLPRCGDPQLSLNASASRVRVRSDFTYTIGVTTGQSPVLGASVTDVIPSGLTLLSVASSKGSCQGVATVVCNLGDLPAGDLETITLKVHADTAGTFANTATLSTTSADSDSSNNASTVQTSVFDPCTGVTLITDPTGDALDQNPAHDVQSVSVAEPAFGPGVNKLVFTIKVASLANVPASTTWPVTFFYGKNAANPPADQQWFVAMKTDPAGQVTFRYGTGTGSTSGAGNLDAGSGFTPDGTITLVISNSKIAPASGGSPSAGQVLKGFLTRVRVESQTGSALVPDNAPDSAAPDGDYELSGNAFCTNAAPTAALSAAPTSGPAPLAVSFNGSGSSDPDSTDTVASYTFRFGDGSTPVTQSTPTVSHTYSSPGSYHATLTVTDSRGLQSANTAAVDIQAATPPAADLAVVKTGPATGKVGQALTYTIKITNRGPDSATAVTATDTLPKNAGFGSVSTTQGTCAPKPQQQVVTCSLGTMASGATVTVTLVIKPTTKGNFTDTATVSATSPNDPVSGNNTSSVTTKVSP